MAEIRALIDIAPIVWSYAWQAVVYFVLAVLLVIAVLRNHFAHHTVRPVIWALAFLALDLSAQSAIRVHTSYLRTIGNTEAYLAMLKSPLWNGLNNLAGFGVTVLIVTLLFAYPESRGKST